VKLSTVLLRVGIALVVVALLGWLPADRSPDPRALFPGLWGLGLLLLAWPARWRRWERGMGWMASLVGLCVTAVVVAGSGGRLLDTPWIALGSLLSAALLILVHHAITSALRQRRSRRVGAWSLAVAASAGLACLAVLFLRHGHHEVLPVLCPVLAGSLALVVPCWWLFVGRRGGERA
jgi:peptidoglycan/LPS O-acetylase OafA/YrhL